MDDALKKSIIDLLQEEQDQLNGALDNQSSTLAPETVEKVSIYQNEDGTWTKDVVQEKTEFVDGGVDQANRSGVKKKAEKLQEFTRAIDQRILSFNAEINVKKDQIVTLSTEATNGNCWPGIAYSSTQVSSVRQAGTGTTTFVESVSVNNEIESIKIYPKMAGPGADNNTDNPFEPDTTIALNGSTSQYAGFGYENVAEPSIYKNSAGSVTGIKTDGSGPGISTNGRLDLSGTGTPFSGSLTCAQIKTQIDSLYTDINVLRNEIGTLRGNLNIVKNKKSEKELQNWGSNNIKSEQEKRKTSNTGVISSVNNLSNL